MSIFVTDTFTEVGTGNVDLDTHTGELGATWTHHPHINYNQNTVLDRDLDRVYTEGGGASAYYASATPPSADYYVQAEFYNVTAIAVNAGVAARMDTTADTMYYGRLNGGTIWQLFKRVATASTQLGSDSSVNVPSAGGAPVIGRLVCQGDQISFIAGGSTVIGPITDSAITAAGKAGVRVAGAASSTTGMHIDTLEAGDFVVATSDPSFQINKLRPAIFTPGLAR